METVVNYTLIFFAYAFAGWIIEVTLKFIQFHRFINRGLPRNQRSAEMRNRQILCETVSGCAENVEEGFLSFQTKR